MSHLNKIVRRVLLEASPVVQGGAITITGKPSPDEPQDAAPAAQPRGKAAAKKVKIDNAIAPSAKVDLESEIVNSSIGYDKSPEEINRLLKATPKKVRSPEDIERARARAGGYSSGARSGVEVREDDYAREEFFNNKRLVSDIADAKSRSDATEILGSAIAGSKVHGASKVKDSAVSDSNVYMSSVSSCELTQATLSAAKLSTCYVRAGTTIVGTLANTPLIALYVTFDGGYQRIQGSGTISTSKLSGCKDVHLDGVKTRIAGSTITLSDVRLEEKGGVAGKISLADIDQSRIEGGVTIKGIDVKIDIGYADISGNAKVIATKPGKSPRVIGFDTQPAVVMGNAKVYDSAFVSGKVMGDAQVFGEAQVAGLATISGDCKVGGTAVMVSGEYTRGVYMEGRHEDGEGPNTLTGMISKGLKSAFGDED